MPTHEHPFERTVCDCPHCRACCIRTPGCLHPVDIPALADFLGISEGELIDEHLELGRGAVLLDKATGHTWTQPSLVPKRNPETGACHWFTGDGCAVHAAAPFGCSHFDTHMGAQEGNDRAVYHQRCIATNRAFLRVIQAKEIERGVARERREEPVHETT